MNDSRSIFATTPIRPIGLGMAIAYRSPASFAAFSAARTDSGSPGS